MSNQAQISKEIEIDEAENIYNLSSRRGEQYFFTYLATQMFDCLQYYHNITFFGLYFTNT